jgi:hypothetical protein
MGRQRRQRVILGHIFFCCGGGVSCCPSGMVVVVVVRLVLRPEKAFQGVTKAAHGEIATAARQNHGHTAGNHGIIHA